MLQKSKIQKGLHTATVEQAIYNLFMLYMY